MRSSVASISGRSSTSSTMERVERERGETHMATPMYAGPQTTKYAWEGSGQQTSISHHYESKTSIKESTSRRSSSSSSSSSGGSSPARRLSSSGGLSLRELNDRLERYIQQVSLTPASNVTHIYRETVSEGGSFRIQDLPQYQTWEKLVREYLEQEEDLARVEADIDRYTQENNDLKERNLSIEQQLMDLKFKMEEKQRMIAELEAKLRNIEIERGKLERIRMMVRPTTLYRSTGALNIRDKNSGP